MQPNALLVRQNFIICKKWVLQVFLYFIVRVEVIKSQIWFEFKLFWNL
jgi:hypothetical protein